MKNKFNIDYEGLKDYLLTLKDSDFSKYENKDGVMKEGNSIMDIELLQMDKSLITLDTVIDYGTSFLVDALGNDLSVVMHTKRKYKLPTGRAVYGIYQKTIIEDCRKLYGTPLNGYWIIPDRFVSKKIAD